MHILRKVSYLYVENNIGGVYMSRRRRNNYISDRLIEELFWCGCRCDNRWDRFDRCGCFNRCNCFDRRHRFDRFR